MPAYPSFFTLANSVTVSENGAEPTRATNGSLRIRRMWSADKKSFDIGHVLSDAQRATLDAFYAANKDANNTYRWALDGVSYTVRFAAPPQYTPRTGYCEARVRLLEV